MHGDKCAIEAPAHLAAAGVRRAAEDFDAIRRRLRDNARQMTTLPF